MAEIKTDKLTIINVSDGEFQLRVEEEKRDCLPCIFLALQDKEGKQYPAIMVRDRIKNKKAYTDTISESWWILLQEMSNIRKLVFLKLDFRGAGKMKFCLDFSPGINNKENRQRLPSKDREHDDMTLSNESLSFQFSLRGWFPMRRLNIARTDDNRLVDIRASSPYRADSTMILSEQPDSLNIRHRMFQDMHCCINQEIHRRDG